MNDDSAALEETAALLNSLRGAFDCKAVWPSGAHVAANAVRLRGYDDRAKVPGAHAVSVGDVLEVARRVQAAP
ncbi:hypothetical protein [Rhodococcus sp. OK519]|uniref:hypothetical protein n=1 Tax=Rhodococcus sp. OK519 TaxID=2135729 RepID=UPI003B974989